MKTRNRTRSVVMRIQLACLATLVAFAIASGATAAPIAGGTVFGIDFGPTPTNAAGNDWVDAAGTAGSPILAGSVHDLDGVTIDGVSVTFSAAGGIFSNNDGPNADYAALQPSTVLNPNFVETVMTDIAGDGAFYSATISGLDDSLTYDIVATSAAFASAGQIETLTINGGTPSAIVRGSPTSQTFHSITGVSSNSGQLDLVFTQSSNNAIVNGILVTAVAPPAQAPEPSTLLLTVLGLVGLCTMRRRKRAATRAMALLLVACTALVATTGDVHAAPIAGGTVFGIDFGPTPTNAAGNDWVDAAGTAGSPILAGSVHDLDGVTIDGVSVTFSASGGIFSNNDGPNADYAALQPTTVLNPNFVETVMTDIAGTGGGAAFYSATISGLDDNLTYDIVATSAAFASGGQQETLTINGGTPSTITRGSPTSQTFHSLSGVSSSSGQLSFVFTQNANNPIVNGILVTAVAPPAQAPEPSSFLLAGIGLLGLAFRRRKRVR